jgi:hypothetical protein
MPFKNKQQLKACYAKNDPKWDCDKWAHETSKKVLAEHTKAPAPKNKNKKNKE